jgi:signal peptidase II
MRFLRLVGIALLICLADRITKLAVLHYFQSTEILSLLPGLNFRLAFNHGVAFSLFFETGRQFPWILVLSSLGLCGVLIAMLWRTPEHQFSQQLALTFILAGALGNISDRLYYGAVIDFIDVYFRQYHWPAFNLADAFICLGAFILMFQSRDCSAVKKSEI